MSVLRSKWYSSHGSDWTYARNRKYDSTRYHGVNLHSFFYRGTVEFRWFEATLHAGKVKAYVTFVLALAARAQNAKVSSRARAGFDPATARKLFAGFLGRLGLNGPEFKNVRMHLMANLPKPSDSRRRAA